MRPVIFGGFKRTVLIQFLPRSQHHQFIRSPELNRFHVGIIRTASGKREIVDILLVEVLEFLAICRATEKIGLANLFLLEGVVKRNSITRRQQTEAEAQSSNPNPTSACPIVPAHWPAQPHIRIVYHSRYSIFIANMRARHCGWPNRHERCRMKTKVAGLFALVLELLVVSVPMLARDGRNAGFLQARHAARRKGPIAQHSIPNGVSAAL